MELDLIDTSSLKIVVMTTVFAEASVFGGMKLTLRVHPDATVGHLQTKVSIFDVVVFLLLVLLVPKLLFRCVLASL